MVGEIGWTNELEDALPYLAKLESLKTLGLLSGSLFWSLYGHAEQYGHVTHDDGSSMYWPTGPEPQVFHFNNPAFRWRHPCLVVSPLCQETDAEPV